jgi:hypothetical protein
MLYVYLKKMWSALQGAYYGGTGLMNQKYHLETNLLPLQIYMDDMPKILEQMKGDKKCMILTWIKEYKKLISYDRLVNVKVAENTYQVFEYKMVNNRLMIKVYEKLSFSMNLSNIPHEWVFIEKGDYFKGVYKPLSPLRCSKMNIVKLSDRLIDNKEWLEHILSIWNKVEMLRISVEAIFREEEMETILKL